MTVGDGRHLTEIVNIDGNPAPEGADMVWIEGRNRKRVRIMFAPDPKGGPKTRGTVIVAPGRTEFIEKYFEVGRDLQARGFAVAIFDWPGQGLSERLMKNPEAGHVQNYGVYVDALVRGMAALSKRAPKPWVILAHSMGGAIMLQALRTKRIDVAAAAFSAPMWGIPIVFFLRWYAHLARFFGFGGMITRASVEETFENNQLTNDPNRWQLYRKLIAAEPRLAVGEPTVGWVVSSLNVTHEFFEPGALDAVRDLPSVIAVADDETIVKKSSQKKLARRFKAGKLLQIDGAKHEILMETDERRTKFWAAFDEMCRRAKV